MKYLINLYFFIKNYSHYYLLFLLSSCNLFIIDDNKIAQELSKIELHIQSSNLSNIDQNILENKIYNILNLSEDNDKKYRLNIKNFIYKTYGYSYDTGSHFNEKIDIIIKYKLSCLDMSYCYDKFNDRERIINLSDNSLLSSGRYKNYSSGKELTDNLINKIANDLKKYIIMDIL